MLVCTQRTRSDLDIAIVYVSDKSGTANGKSCVLSSLQFLANPTCITISPVVWRIGSEDTSNMLKDDAHHLVALRKGQRVGIKQIFWRG